MGSSEGALKANSTTSGGAASGKIAIKLDSDVSAGGSNFSQGQRQLLGKSYRQRKAGWSRGSLESRSDKPYVPTLLNQQWQERC